ncbi:uncharacterized protein LOC142475790 isoform X2 [Ascaphus truei]|uniref:uncharacterized protein LOC142475790 isoform X2 n=1 Tax=Ascaphus truei TaxID=8439 RepID=UPI003F5967A8
MVVCGPPKVTLGHFAVTVIRHTDRTCPDLSVSGHRTMFHFLSHCWRWVQVKQEPIRRVTVLFLGLDSAGKSSVIRVIRRAPPCQITPSTDPLRTDLRLDRSDVTLLELPGGHKARAVWHLHYPQAHALVFVVDASDHERLKEVASVLSSVLRHPRMAGKPLLILANKQDRASALIPSEVIESLSLETLVNENKTLCRIEPCCAGTDFNSHHDWSILKGLRWALQSVTINYPTLSARVLQETAEQRDSHRRSMRAPGRTHGDRALPGLEMPHDSITNLVEYKPFLGVKKRPLKPIQNILTQTGHSLRSVKKRRTKVKVKESDLPQEAKEQKGKKWGVGKNAVPSGGALQPQRGGQRSLILPQTQHSDQAAGPKKSKKKRKKTVHKNQIKSQEAGGSTQSGDTGNTFDLYRRAMEALKLKQEQQRARLTPSNQEVNPRC